MKAHKAKKTLGQNFLKSEGVLLAIVKAGEVNGEDTVLEIGPGKGALTSKLLQKASKVLAVEKDQDLIPILKEKFAQEVDLGKLTLIQEDILEFDLEEKGKILGSNPYKVIANIPYNITGAIFKKFLTSLYPPSLMVLLVQKEVAQRVMAKDGKESLLSLSVKAYGVPSYIMKVAARYFSPAPKVDSAVIKIDKISHNFFIKNKLSEKIFWELLHAGFAHKRKVLLGNLKTWQSKVNWVKIFEKCKIDPKIRAEDLSIDEWRDVCTAYQSLA